MNAIGEVSVAISAAFTGSLELNASFSISPPTIALLIEVLATFDAQVSFALALSLPTVSFGLDASLAAIAKLNLAFSLVIALDLLLSLAVQLFGTGVLAPTGLAVATQLTVEYATGWPDGFPPGTAATALMFVCVTVPISLPPPLNPNIAADKIKLFLNGIPWGTSSPSTNSTKGSIGEIVKVTAAAMVQANAGIQYQLDLALSLAAHFNVTPPSFDATLSAMAKFQADLLANIDLALPKVKFAIDAALNISASLNAKFNFLFDLGFSLSPSATMYVYKYVGTVANIIPDFALEIGATAFPNPNTWGNHDSHAPSIFFPCTVGVVGSANPVPAIPVLAAFFSGVWV